MRKSFGTMGCHGLHGTRRDRHCELARVKDLHRNVNNVRTSSREETKVICLGERGNGRPWEISQITCHCTALNLNYD